LETFGFKLGALGQKAVSQAYETQRNSHKDKTEKCCRSSYRYNFFLLEARSL
jgi:hypothetical protein